MLNFKGSFRVTDILVDVLWCGKLLSLGFVRLHVLIYGAVFPVLSIIMMQA